MSIKGRLVFIVITLCLSDIAKAVTYYVNAARPSDTGDGTGWATAKKTIQAAVNLAVSNDTVLVTNGVYNTGTTVTPGYTLNNRLVITNAITVRSINGPASTIIEGSGTPFYDTSSAIRCVYMNRGLLEGFTLRNGTTLGISLGDSDEYERSGGGVNMYNAATGTIVTNCIVQYCMSPYGGGSYYGTLNNCTLTDNTATLGGGSYSGTLNNCTLTGNTVNYYGGGSYYSTLNNCMLTGNTANNDGGGSYGGTLNNCTLTGNTATLGGGSYGGTLNNCTLTGNTANNYGGGSYSDTLNNCTLTENTAVWGGGSSGGTLNNCTLTENTAFFGGGSNGGTLNNCIVWDNYSSSNGQIKNYSASTFLYSCTFPLPPGEGNISGNPLFVNAANGNFQVMSGSSCIDSGKNNYVVGLTDILGKPRIENAVVDMGAYEYALVVTLTFDGDGHTSGTCPVPISDVYGRSVILPVAGSLSRVGYLFGGWNNISGWKGTNYLAGDAYKLPAFDVTLFAQWTPEKYSVLFDDNNDSSRGASIFQVYAGKYVLPSNPTILPRDGDYFTGWWTSVTGGAQVTSNTTVSITNAITLYAHWTNTYTVVFNPQGGSVSPTNKVVNYASAYGVLPVPVRDGYGINGWWTLPDAEGTHVTEETIVSITATQVLYAAWTNLAITIFLNGNDGQVSTNKLVSFFDRTYGYGGQTLPDATRTGYTFQVWQTVTNGVWYTVTNESVVAQWTNHVLTATWKGNVYAVTLDSNGGNGGTSDVQPVFGLPMPAANAPLRPGYTFSGYYDAPEGGIQYYTTTMISVRNWDKIESFTLYAHWVPNTYTLVYHPEEGVGSVIEQICNYGNEFALRSNSFSRLGYKFEGWGTSSTVSSIIYIDAQVVSNLTEIANGTINLYAKWSDTPYYVINGNDVIAIGGPVNLDLDNSGDGGTSLKIGGLGLLNNGEMAGIEWSGSGTGYLIFDWKVSSEDGYDFLRFYEVGSSETNSISGTAGGWTRHSVLVIGSSDDVRTFRWEYVKDETEYVGLDCGWVDAIQWYPAYELTINNGTGGGFYTNRSTVAITADVPPHFDFDCWTGDTNGVSSIYASSTTLLMSATNVSLTAVFKPVFYPLDVTNGSGDGSYVYQAVVEIRADNIEGKRFYRWTGDTAVVMDIYSPTTTVTRIGSPTTLTATYCVPLTVNSGTGSGWYPEGSAANVSADADPLWKEFAAWTGDVGLISNLNARTTTLTMQTGPASVTASYKDSISRLTGSYGRTYSGSGTAGAITPDAAGSPSGTPAVKLGGSGVIPDNGFAAFETVVSGRGTISFWWRVSSQLNADFLKFKIDGMETNTISGTKGPWTQVTRRVEGEGTHTLRWEYVKDASVASSTDAGWVDDIIWTPDTPDPMLSPFIIHAALTNQAMAIQFMGERGIPYCVQTNATLNPSGWADCISLYPLWLNESNGVHRFEITPPPSGSPTMFCRVKTSSTTP